MIIVSAAVILSGLATVVHSTGLGRQLRAIAENPAAAESLGIDRRAATYRIGITATLLAAYAGVLIGFETNLQPTMGGSYTIKAFAAMVLGGLGNIWGTLAGAFILGFIENFGIGLEIGGVSLPAGYKDAFAFVIILVVLLVRPSGLFGLGRRVA
jgi:branched-chain amino acid transport system permease protein